MKKLTALFGSTSKVQTDRKYRQNRKLSTILSVMCLLASSQLSISKVSAQTTNTKWYQGTWENFPNPERGFFVPIDPLFSKAVSPLTLSELQAARSKGMTLVRRVYLLESYKTQPLAQSVLDRLAQDCETARNAGVKLIVRFAYNWLGGGPDAPRDRILGHLEQLRPVLQANYDAIAYMDAGFIGKWGEWHSSSNNLVDNWTLDVTNDARTIFKKILEVLPPQRMVAIRYIKQKRQMFYNANAVSPQEAFNGIERSRTGHHNDAFRGGLDDAGTYGTNSQTVVDELKSWLNLDTRFVLQGGEPAWTSSYDDCPGTMSDLKQMHWSSLNAEQPDAKDVYQGWINQGCMEDIKRRLGYRFRLNSSQVPTTVKPGSTFSVSFGITNDGWASPYNSRKLELVLRNRATKAEYRWNINDDPRYWSGGSSKTVNFTGTMPASTPTGTYDVFLNLPDPTAKLNKRPAFSIRLANQYTWEASTGYNSLLQSINVQY